MTPDIWFWISLIVCLLSTVICVVAALAKKGPNDVTILSVATVELFLLVYLVASIMRQANGEQISGAGWEFWGYLITVVVLPIGAVYWSLLERSRWSNLVLGAVGLIVIVMMYRMMQIWYGVAVPVGS
ncbi:hypothetical membrane protein [Renibacterium salmoninarum ATCC 33209]|uniref:Hypothetical membrane protein n=1 Tax=Renibacterium salmoninarum (strain ATCC 33209 / DSM 20767 / JCM 11484 / NBRC 15589 / NCIMB 2235) TaxID=288705 RepID=A9WPW3_RENSM|nr:hypothetical protein [Renibacterium salmoninarum]ABY22408.1 hypothetical membrane protein [Renibacterium salmoninarum ATCC 33209]